MNTPNVTLANINPRWIYITWTGISGDNQTGGDPASFYGLEWDQGSGVYVNLTTLNQGMIFSFNLTSTTPFPSGMNILLRTYGINGVGKGVYSAPLMIIADKVPQYMSTPIVDHAAITPT